MAGVLLGADRTAQRRGVMTTAQAVENCRVLAGELRKIPRSVRSGDQDEMILTFDTIVEMWTIYQSEIMGGLSYRARPG